MDNVLITGAAGELIKSNHHHNFSFLKVDLADRQSMENLFNCHSFDVVINLAAQAGVRYSLENPHEYTSSNVEGYLNILEGCRHSNFAQLIYASSSSVYGANAKVPFNTADRVDKPSAYMRPQKRPTN